MRLGVLRSTVYQVSTPIDRARGEGNCGRATDRGKEAGAKTCEATNRNRIQGRSTQASVPCNTKPFSSRWEGKCGACAGKVHVLIRGDLPDVPGSRACPKARAVHAQATRCWAEVSRRHSTRSDTPLGRGRPERDAQVLALLTSLRQGGRVPRLSLTVNRQRQPAGKMAWTDTRIERSSKTRLESPSALKRTPGGCGGWGPQGPRLPDLGGSPQVPGSRDKHPQVINSRQSEKKIRRNGNNDTCRSK